MQAVYVHHSDLCIGGAGNSPLERQARELEARLKDMSPPIAPAVIDLAVQGLVTLAPL